MFLKFLVLDTSRIKTEVKEEPKDDFDILGGEDEVEVDPISSEEGEEDDDLSEDGEDSDNETGKAGGKSKEQESAFYWDKLRMNEIAMEADIKPDISKIKIINNDSIMEKANKDKAALLKSDKQAEEVDEDEELAALYSSMNPDD